MPKGEKKARYPKLAEQVRQGIEDRGETQAAVAAALGLNRTTVQRWCRRFGWKTQSTGPRPGPAHPGWRGGRVVNKGYVYLYRPDHPNATIHGYVLEHRLVAETQILGRLLLRTEVVHHRNRDRQDNRPENLVVFGSNPDHLRHELTGRTPNWSPEGRARTLEGARRPRGSRRQSGSDVHLPPQSTAHPPASPDSTDEGRPACETEPTPEPARAGDHPTPTPRTDGRG